MNKVRCPNCNAECDPGEPSCPSCGRYLGVRRYEPELPPEPQVQEDETHGIPRPLWWFMNMFPGLFNPAVVIMAVVAIAVACVLAWLALFLAMFGAIAAFLIGGAGMVCYWTAIAWVMYGDLTSPSEALSEFDSAQWTVFALLAMLPVVGVAMWAGGSS